MKGRRFAAALLIAAAGVFGGAGAATAAPPAPPSPTAPATPTPRVSAPGVYVPPGTRPAPPTVNRPEGSLPPEPADCKRPPNPGAPRDGLAGLLDEGPTAPGTGLYSTYGYGGFAPVIYDPGCPVNANPIAGLQAAQKRLWDGPNAATDFGMQAMLVATAVVVQATRLVLGDSQWWGIFDHLTGFMQQTLAVRLWAAFGLFAFAATGFYWMARSGKGDVPEAAKSSARGVVIVGVAALCMGWTLTVGALVNNGVNAVWGATSEITAGEATGPDVAIGDAVIGNIIFPVWQLVHFGNNPETAKQFGSRLFAAGAFSRAEQARLVAEPTSVTTLIHLKKVDYRAVSAEIEAANPAAYEHLAGASTSDRVGYVFFGIVGVAAVTFTLAYALMWVGLLKIGVRLVVAAWPALALVTQFPTLQFIAANIARMLSRFAVTACVMLAVFVAFMVGGVNGILNAPYPIAARVVALAVLVGTGRYVWVHRSALVYKRTGVDKDQRQMRSAAAAVHGRFQSWSGGPRERPGPVPVSEKAAAGASRMAATAKVVSAAVQRRPGALVAAAAAATKASAKAAPGKVHDKAEERWTARRDTTKPAKTTPATPEAVKAADAAGAPVGEKKDKPRHSARPRPLTPQAWPEGEHSPRQPNPTPDQALPGLTGETLTRHEVAPPRKETVNAYAHPDGH